MKKIISVLLTMVMFVCLSACSGETSPKEPAKVMETEQAKIEGVFVDNSYKDDGGKPLKMVYLFLTFKSNEKNFEVDAKYTKLIIGENTYESDFYKGSCDFMPSYYYSSFLEEIYVGNESKVALTFKVPEGDLQLGKTVTLSDYDMPVSGLTFLTDDFIMCDSLAEIAKTVDAAGYAEIEKKHAIADDETTKKVQKGLNGYYWTFYVTLGTSLQKHELEFTKPNKFEIRTSYISNTGTYEVHNGYIYLHYTTSDNVVEIPYEFKDGEIELDCDTAFSIYE